MGLCLFVITQRVFILPFFVNVPYFVIIKVRVCGHMFNYVCAWARCESGFEFGFLFGCHNVSFVCGLHCPSIENTTGNTIWEGLNGGLRAIVVTYGERLINSGKMRGNRGEWVLLSTRQTLHGVGVAGVARRGRGVAMW